jgi:hypothetical protein
MYLPVVLVTYKDFEEFKDLCSQAREKHMEALPILLDFPWINAESFVSDLGHDNVWLYEGGSWLAIMTKGLHIEWGNMRAARLLSTIRQVMTVIISYNSEKIEKYGDSSFKSDLKAFNLVKDAVEEDLKEIMEDLENCALFESYYTRRVLLDTCQHLSLLCQ